MRAMSAVCSNVVGWTSRLYRLSVSDEASFPRLSIHDARVVEWFELQDASVVGCTAGVSA